VYLWVKEENKEPAKYQGTWNRFAAPVEDEQEENQSFQRPGHVLSEYPMTETVSPMEDIGENLVNDQDMENPGGQGEGEGEESEKAQIRKSAGMPTKEEIDECNLDHAVYRAWRPHCVRGKAQSHPHVRVDKKITEIPTVSVDYMYLGDGEHRSKGGSHKEDKGMPLLVAKDDATKMCQRKEGILTVSRNCRISFSSLDITC
jgi:hypothetical protein